MLNDRVTEVLRPIRSNQINIIIYLIHFGGVPFILGGWKGVFPALIIHQKFEPNKTKQKSKRHYTDKGHEYEYG